MKKLVLSCLAFGFVTAFAQNRSIVETALANSSFSTLVKALQAADLVDALEGDGPFTVLAPTDAAFAALPDGVLADLLKPENNAKLANILTFHVIAGDAKPLNELLAGKVFDALNKEGLSVAFLDGAVRVNDAAAIKTADISCKNGIIHVIDAVLLPPPSGPASIIETAEAAGSFSTLLAAVKAAGLVDDLSVEGPITVFAPTDAAFAALPKETLTKLLTPEGKADLANILTYHVVSGAVSAGDALNAASADAVNGQPLSFTFSSGEFRVNKAKLLTADIKAANGVIHVIDTVLLPPAKTTSKPAAKPTASAANAMRLLEVAISHGVPIFNDGDPAGCATVYAHASKKLAADKTLPAAVRNPLQTSLAKAAKTSSGRSRAWILRDGIDRAYATLSLSLNDVPAAEPKNSSDEKVPADTKILTDFSDANVASQWKTVNDNVMGGRSSGGPSFADGQLTFSGATNTDGGGFSSIRTNPTTWDTKGADGVVFRIKGDGRSYFFDVRRKTEKSRMIAYRAEFKTKKGWAWNEVRIPFSEFKPTTFGMPIPGPKLTAEDVSTVGFMIYDKKDGPFRLLVDWVGVYTDQGTAQVGE